MARPLSPQEATEMIMALRRQQPGAPSYRPASTRRTKRANPQPAKEAGRTSDTAPETETEE